MQGKKIYKKGNYIIEKTPADSHECVMVIKSTETSDKLTFLVGSDSIV